MKVKSESEAIQSCLTRSDPRDCSLPGSSVHGIFQARVLEWLPLLSHVQICVTPWTVAPQLPLSMGQRQEIQARILEQVATPSFRESS